MTFKERYTNESTWHGKVTIMEIYHLAMCHRERNWTVTKTAEHFECSIGLVSENLRLAYTIHLDDKILKCESRQAALKKLSNRRT
jgi:hypothetical protein